MISNNVAGVADPGSKNEALNKVLFPDPVCRYQRTCQKFDFRWFTVDV